MRDPEMNAGSFKDAYGVLQQHAETLREQAEPNIDDLLTIVAESVEAYKICRERIDAVEAALKAALDGVGTGSGPGAPLAAESAKSTQEGSVSARRAPRAAVVPVAPEANDDDIPF